MIEISCVLFPVQNADDLYNLYFLWQNQNVQQQNSKWILGISLSTKLTGNFFPKSFEKNLVLQLLKWFKPQQQEADCIWRTNVLIREIWQEGQPIGCSVPTCGLSRLFCQPTSVVHVNSVSIILSTLRRPMNQTMSELDLYMLYSIWTLVRKSGSNSLDAIYKIVFY